MVRIRLDVLVGAALAAAISTVSADDPKVASRKSLPDVPAGAARLEVRNATGLVGQTITLEAVLTRVDGGGPLAGRSVSFRVKGAPGGDVAAGNGQTDASGRAKVPFKVPEIKQGSYELAAVSSGGAPTAGVATDTARIGIFKAETKLALEETTPTGGGHGYGNPEARTHQWVRISLTRKSGGEAVTGRKVRLTLDGKPFGDHATGNVMLPDGPFPAGLAMVPWVVEALFEGDDCYQSTEPARLVVKKKP